MLFGKHLFISLFRAVQAIGIAAIPVVSATIIGDLFEGKERVEAMSLYQMLLALAPAIAPLIGGYLGSINGHLSVFLFLSTLGIILLMINISLLPETKPNVIKQSKAQKNYSLILKIKLDFLLLLLASFNFVFTFAFSFLPSILTNSFHLTVNKIGLMFVPMSLSIMLGSFCYKFCKNASQQSKLYLLRVSSILYVSFYSLSHIASISPSSLSLHLCTVLVWDFLCQLTLLY